MIKQINILMMIKLIEDGKLKKEKSQEKMMRIHQIMRIKIKNIQKKKKVEY